MPGDDGSNIQRFFKTEKNVMLSTHCVLPLLSAPNIDYTMPFLLVINKNIYCRIRKKSIVQSNAPLDWHTTVLLACWLASEVKKF